MGGKFMSCWSPRWHVSSACESVDSHVGVVNHLLLNRLRTVFISPKMSNACQAEHRFKKDK